MNTTINQAHDMSPTHQCYAILNVLHLHINLLRKGSRTSPQKCNGPTLGLLLRTIQSFEPPASILLAPIPVTLTFGLGCYAQGSFFSPTLMRRSPSPVTFKRWILMPQLDWHPVNQAFNIRLSEDTSDSTTRQ